MEKNNYFSKKYEGKINNCLKETNPNMLYKKLQQIIVRLQNISCATLTDKEPPLQQENNFNLKHVLVAFKLIKDVTCNTVALLIESKSSLFENN